MFLTIFTPTYNRAYVLPRLYDSLCNQTDSDFEWVIVDDGSTDSTKNLIASWIEEKKILLRYFYQENSGKMIAHNRGAEKAQGDYFVCLDSDDYFAMDAVEKIKENVDISNEECVGLIGNRVLKNGVKITKVNKRMKQFTTLRDAYKKYGLQGDTMLVFRSRLVKKYRFELCPGDKFIPEGFLYNQIDTEGLLKYSNIDVYICEYLQDGYSAHANKIIYQNYRSYISLLNQRMKMCDSFTEVLFDTMRYNAIMIKHHEKKIVKQALHPFISFISFVPSIFLGYLKYKDCVE